ncbi:MAG: ankyrin repeat domain-containing protein [Polyangiaceae bacterium]
MSKTRIIECVRTLDFAATKALLDERPSLLGVKDAGGRNLLNLACSASCSDLGVPQGSSKRLVRLLLDRGIDVESTVVMDDQPCNSVWFAVARGRNATLVEFLIERGATARGLFAAGWHEDLAILKALVNAGASVDEVAEDETPFLHCWKTGRFKAAKFLLRSGANVNFQDSKGRTALHYGLKKGLEPSLLRFLVRSGASPDIADCKGVSARQQASRKRDKTLLAALNAD